jgi:predicted Zn-dependent protease
LFISLFSALAQDLPVEAPSATPQDGTPAAVDAMSFGQGLQQAKRSYLSGDLDSALRQFVDLQVMAAEDPTLEWRDVASSLVYLAEVYIKLGQPDKATPFFEQIVRRDPTYQISPYYHPTDVIGA